MKGRVSIQKGLYFVRAGTSSARMAKSQYVPVMA